MGTPATYVFLPDANQPRVTAVRLYDHYDGYPEGAAAKFLAAAMLANQRGGMPMTFIRANPDTEFCASGVNHGESFRYYVTENNINAVKVMNLAGGHSKEFPLFSGALVTFINTYNQLHKQFVCTHAGRIMTQDMLEQIISERLVYAAHAQKQGWTGNSCGAANDAWRYYETYRNHYGSSEFGQNTVDVIDYLDSVHCIAMNWKDDEFGTAFQNWQRTFGRDSGKKYRLIYMFGEKMHKTEGYMAGIEREFAKSGYFKTGVNAKKSSRVELHGMPIFAGLNGPMWDGDAVRYECAETYKALSE